MIAHNAVKIGDIFVYSWGYEQTNIDFFKVLKRTPKTVTVAKIPSRVDVDKSIGAMTGRAFPVKWAAPIGQPRQKRIQEDSDGALFLSMAYGVATLYDGKGEFTSWYG
jgi:hypothetical protein